MISICLLLHAGVLVLTNHQEIKLTPCSLGLSATIQQHFSLRTNQPPTTSQQYFLSRNKPAPAISHQPNEQAVTLHNRS
jgi:hypothetical protein